MTSAKQITANRLNALKSTGPRTAEGKQRSRQNAFRHGLAAETVIAAFESAADYRALENSLVADYQPASSLEHFLVCKVGLCSMALAPLDHYRKRAVPDGRAAHPTAKHESSASDHSST